MARAAPVPPPEDDPHDATARFETLYRACYQDLLTFALRRCDRPEAAADVVADTFLVAWRRIDEIPAERARLWLFGVARNVLANHHRSVRRRADLAARLRQELAAAEVVQPEVPDDIGRAFRSLSEADRELLRLVAWEGLAADELAVVLDCSTNAARIRLHRARRRFAVALRQPSLTR
ncbi:sigma-70 family RNA polymerase sigma factor [Micromonospora sp. WMMD1102]|uniref:RNA polymerase sigma factor n=1 Tax=Micromonospora sp. WMMD1102 TaxID=3016105 RepID=UPI0024158535|nr:sigma-70 family RNA polymerase sigma factor [Micromonospora sp. WMMD1102]MDG4789800.1 sigma-70 family RNA polymerase sigma factor [Micromonospora sp. WMMD1102]